MNIFIVTGYPVHRILSNRLNRGGRMKIRKLKSSGKETSNMNGEIVLQDEKIDNSLNLSLQLPEAERMQSESLRYGYNQETKRWQIIVKYIGDIKRFEEIFQDTEVVELLNQYAIITTREEYIAAIAAMPEIEYVEKPKKLYFNLEQGRNASCISGVQRAPGFSGGQAGMGGGRLGLSGKGVLVGIIDSGIDYFHATFRDAEGNTRIRYLWDQSAGKTQSEGRTPAGYGFGAQYSSEDINEALRADNTFEGESIVPVTDRGSGHGTAVAGVAAGNGGGSEGNRYRGIAVESELLVVRLGRSAQDFAGTTEVMEGIDYVMRKAIELQMPVAINLSFGNNNGAHDGQSLFENYITSLNGVWKNAIIIASGNEGDARHHATLQLAEREESVSFAVGTNERSLSLQIWKSYLDDFAIWLESPSGQRIQVVREEGSAITYNVGPNKILIFYGAPNPYMISQEVFIEWIPRRTGDMVESGIWKVWFAPEEIKDGAVNLWLPTIEAVGLSTGFLTAEPDTTLTIPSTARNVITVGAYQSDNNSVASFSGRGNTTDRRNMPTLVAPGVGVITALPGGGYGPKTGTSIAAPFVTGSAALMMEWGIVQGNDPYLYGEKIKAYLMKGARPLPGESVPSVRQGYGALCLRESIPV